MALLLLIVVSVFGLLGSTWGQNFYIAAPAKLRLDAEQTIGLAIDGNQGAITEVYIQDHPEKLKNITHAVIAVQPDEPILLKINLDSANFPPTFFNSPGSAKLVSVTAANDKFRKEILVPITIQSGYVFIQMDKPIYTPDQRALIRIIYLNEDTLPSDKPFKLQIKNPDRLIVEERFFNKRAERAFKPFDTHVYRFPRYSNHLGEWSATARYGYEFQQETSVYFQLEEYDLPTFTVEVKTPVVILPSTDIIRIGVLARHVYGESVQGIVTFRIGIKRNSTNINFFASIASKELDQGSYEVKISTDDLKKNKDIGWFPSIEGSQLAVEAIVVEDASGNSEKSMVVNTMFSKSPFVISFKRCPTDFKPGFSSIFEADITYFDGKPAEGILTKIKVMADDNKPLNILKDFAVSDDAGKVSFEIHPELTHSSVYVTLETNDPRYVGSQTVGHFVQRKFQSRNNAYIAISRGSAQQLQRPGDMFSKLIFYDSGGVLEIYYMIISKGKIITLKKLPTGAFKVRSIQFQITHEMVPFFRLVVFAHYRGEFIADSLKVDVERVCDPNAEITVESEFNNKEPGGGGRFNLRGTSGTWVGLINMDESVYFLSKKDLLTKAKMFDTLASHDFGCGPGGGLSVSQVLQNAGIIIGTNHYTLVSTNGTGLENQRCALEVQEDKLNGNHRVRKSVGLRQLEEHNNYSKALENRINERHDYRHKRDLFEDYDFIDIEEEDHFDMCFLIRRDFRQTHIFDDKRIGSDGKSSYEVYLHHTITTWVISAVSVSPQNGMCVAEPQKLVSFKKIFLELNLPYSVVINQQIEIQATVFNHGTIVIPATVYMYGVKDLCTGTQPGQKSERQRLVINPHSSKSVTFPVIPLKVQIFQIKVVMLTPEGNDVIEKGLRVLPEGITEEVQIEIKLDPTNSQQRRRLQIETDAYTDTIDSSKSLQVTAVKLQYPENFVPGTASCWITAIGDKMVKTTVVETNINNPDALLQKPQGSGEQNMVLLAQTLYTMSYLKETGKITAAREAKGYEYIRTGIAFCVILFSFRNRW